MALIDMIKGRLQGPQMASEAATALDEQDAASRAAMEALGASTTVETRPYETVAVAASDFLAAVEGTMEAKLENHYGRTMRPATIHEACYYALEETLPEGLVPPEYDPAADLRQLEEISAGVQAALQADPDQPNPEDDIENSTTIGDLSNAPQDIATEGNGPMVAIRGIMNLLSFKGNTKLSLAEAKKAAPACFAAAGLSATKCDPNRSTADVKTWGEMSPEQTGGNKLILCKQGGYTFTILLINEAAAGARIYMIGDDKPKVFNAKQLVKSAEGGKKTEKPAEPASEGFGEFLEKMQMRHPRPPHMNASEWAKAHLPKYNTVEGFLADAGEGKGYYENGGENYGLIGNVAVHVRGATSEDAQHVKNAIKAIDTMFGYIVDYVLEKGTWEEENGEAPKYNAIQIRKRLSVESLHVCLNCARKNGPHILELFVDDGNMYGGHVLTVECGMDNSGKITKPLYEVGIEG